jgi:hypothetical protein
MNFPDLRQSCLCFPQAKAWLQKLKSSGEKIAATGNVEILFKSWELSLKK